MSILRRPQPTHAAVVEASLHCLAGSTMQTQCFCTRYDIHFVAIWLGCFNQSGSVSWTRWELWNWKKTLCGSNEIPNPLPPPMPKKYSISSDLCSKRMREFFAIPKDGSRGHLGLSMKQFIIFPREMIVFVAGYMIFLFGDRLIFPLCAIVVVKL